MTHVEQVSEACDTIDEVLSRWAPFNDEPANTRMIRALLHLAAYEKDVERVQRGERPIRTDYPLPLPTCETRPRTTTIDATAPLVKPIDKGDIVLYKGGHHRVTAVFSKTCNLAGVFGGGTKTKGVPLAEVKEDYAAWSEKWSKSEAYQCM